MRINNKTFKEWTEDDINSILNDEAFRESQFLDYKRTFEFLEGDKSQKSKGKDEFRNDVCSFANADGGDLLFGISEKNGLAFDIIPINIEDTDRFELNLRNILLPIMPSMPPVDFNFISVFGGYIVVVHIEKGIFKPYMTIENQTVFRFFIRHGNRKEAMSYSEISNNFLHAASLASEMKKFRLERVSELLEDNAGLFGVIHVIPATFQNPADFISMCDWGKSGGIPLPYGLNNHIMGSMLPNVNGIWFPSDDGLRDFELLTIFDNGSVELKQDLYTNTHMENKYLVSDEFISAIDDIVKGTAELYKSWGRHSTVYICISIIGCKGYWNYDTCFSRHPQPSRVDRDRILCAPIEIRDILDAENVSEMIEECKKRTRYALGIKR
ncbi:MAG: ATP-binding protein [Clostridiales bacterium]|nr:ATP-binding protein [Clostridiales bacterium]